MESKTVDMRLWYNQSAREWEEALPIGNGRLAAMIFGEIETEHLQLNEDTLYSGEPGRRDLPVDITKDFYKVVQMLRDGDHAPTDKIIEDNWLGRAQPCYQPLGDLYLRFEGHSEASNYVRELDISKAVARVSYKKDDVCFSREIFASYPDQVIIIRLSADKSASLTFRAFLNSVHPTAQTRSEGNNQLIMIGQMPGIALRRDLDWVEKNGDQWKYPEIWDKDGKRHPCAEQALYSKDVDGIGMHFDSRLKVKITGGQISVEGNKLAIREADEAILILSADSSYSGFDKSPSREGVDPAIQSMADIISASQKDYHQLRADHVTDYQSLFDRVFIDLGKPTEQSNLPTDERLKQFSNGQDPSLASLYFQFGRYLMISGSRQGTQPLNLQGMWNPHVIPPWAGAYTININAEMNYWPAETTNLSECHEPLLRMIRELSVSGQEVATKMYGRKGWIAHHNTTIWRCAQPVDNAAGCSFWGMAAGWLCQHLWDHYLFTGDEKFLSEKAYPLMKGAAEFYLDWLVDNGNGFLVTPVSTSPENVFIYTDKDGNERRSSVSMGCTMDMAIIREVFVNCIEASEIIEVDTYFRQILLDTLDKLLPYQIGSKGQLQEWQQDFKEANPKHRHLSHMYALHPSNQITRRETPELFEAAHKTLELRGDEATGWSIGWKINFWARMEDGNHAYKLIQNLISPQRTYPNMFDAHPPFQIDGNFGGTAGMAEMLLQSHAGELNLLPALPDSWPSGSVKGLCARGGFEIDISWADGKLLAVEILSKLGKACVVRYGEEIVKIETEAGKTYKLTPENIS